MDLHESSSSDDRASDDSSFDVVSTDNESTDNDITLNNSSSDDGDLDNVSPGNSTPRNGSFDHGTFDHVPSYNLSTDHGSPGNGTSPNASSDDGPFDHEPLDDGSLDTDDGPLNDGSLGPDHESPDNGSLNPDGGSPDEVASDDGSSDEYQEEYSEPATTPKLLPPVVLPEKTSPRPSLQQVDTTLRVLRFVAWKRRERTRDPSERNIESLIKIVEDHFGLPRIPCPDYMGPLTGHADRPKESSKPFSDSGTPRMCYACNHEITTPHRTKRYMCQPCGQFNHDSTELSQPDSLYLNWKATLVTDVHDDMGYHTSLRLLRCFAQVMVTSRYPNATAVRYFQEPDFHVWGRSLKVVGADFRTTNDVVVFTKAAKAILDKWEVERFDIAINNSGRIFPSTVEYQERGIFREESLRQEAESIKLDLIYKTDYKPRPVPVPARGIANLAPKIIITPASPISGTDPSPGIPTEPPHVPYVPEDPHQGFISTRYLNGLVPLLLCKELLSLMGTYTSPPDEFTWRKEDTPGMPADYMINVSSRGSIFEKSPSYFANVPRGNPEVTNLIANIISQTDPAVVWKEKSVAMNTADPGFPPASIRAHSYDGEIRLGWREWEVVVGRLLWPVVNGEILGAPVWGRFLKDYSAVPAQRALQEVMGISQ